jgi:hypothetical protein
VTLNGSLVELEFHRHYSQYRWKILNSPVHGLPADADAWANVICLMMVSEPASPLLQLGPGGRTAVIFLFWLLTETCGPASLATMVSEPASHLLAIGSGRVGNNYLFTLATNVDTWASNYFFGMNVLP